MKKYFSRNIPEILSSVLVSFLFWGSLFKYPYRYLFGDFDLAITYFVTAKISLLDYHEFPFFSSYIGGGFPVWAHPQNMLMSIPQFFSLMINNQWLAIRISIVALSIISILGMFSLLRQLEINNFWCRLFGAIVYTFSGFLVSHLIVGHFVFQNVVYVPWLASAFLWSYKNDKFSYSIPILLAVMVYAGLNVTSIFIIIISLSFLTFYNVKRFILYALLAILLSLPKLIFSYQLLSWFPRNLTMGYVSESWYGTLHTLITALVSPRQSSLDNSYKYVSAEIHSLNCYVGILVLILTIFSIIQIKKHKYLKFSVSMLLTIFTALFLYPGRLNPFWSLLSKNLILGSLHMPSWFIGLFVLPFAYFSTLGLYSIENIFKKNTNIILICICVFIFWDYFRVNKPNLDYVQTTFTLNNKAYFSKNNSFEHDKGPDWNLILFKDKLCFESDMMSTYLQDNKGVLQFYDSILGYDEFGFLRHSSVKSGQLGLYNKNQNVKIGWISPSKISVEILKIKQGQLEIPININYFPGWQVVTKIPGVTLNKNWSPEKWGLLTVYIDEQSPIGNKQKILLKYSPYWNFKSYSKKDIVEAKQSEPIPKTAESWYKRGEELYGSYDFDNAILAFDNAIKINPNYILAWEAKGWILIKMKKSKETVNCFDKVSFLEKNNSRYRNVFTTNRDAKDYFIRAAAFSTENRFNEAIADFNTAIRLNKNYIKAYYCRGRVYRLNQEYDKAIMDFNKVIEFNHENLGVYYSRSEVYKQIKHYQNAISDLTMCIQINPKDTKYYNDLGILFADLKRYNEAEKYFYNATKIDSKYVEPHYNLGKLYYNLKRYKESEKEYKKAIKINQDYERPHYNLGNLFYNLKKYKEAEKEYKEAIRINPSYLQAYNNLGALLYSLKRYDEAEQVYKEAIRINPNYSDAHMNLAILLRDLKRYEEADAEYKKAMSAN